MYYNEGDGKKSSDSSQAAKKPKIWKNNKNSNFN